jgi:hypothetical protein
MHPLLQHLRRKLMATVLWQALFVLAIAWGFYSTHMAEQTAMGRIRFSTMDSRGSFYLSNLGSFDSSEQIHSEIAKMAVETIFSRNPEGYDQNERMERLFNPITTALLRKDAEKDNQIFRVQQIHQKVETGPIKELAVDQDTAKVSVECQVMRDGMFNSKLVNVTKKATVFLTMKVNDDMATNGRYPLVVTEYFTRYP